MQSLAIFTFLLGLLLALPAQADDLPSATEVSQAVCGFSEHPMGLG